MKSNELDIVPAKIEEIKDGDTLQVRPKRGNGFRDIEWVRLRGVDTPEQSPSDKAERELDRVEFHKRTFYNLGRKATAKMTELLEGRKLFLHCERREGVDPPYLYHNRYRLLAYITLDSPDGDDLGEQLIRTGYALVWPRGNSKPYYTHPRIESYLSVCNRARKEQEGLWAKGLSELCPLKKRIDGEATLLDCVRFCHPACYSDADARREMAKWGFPDAGVNTLNDSSADVHISKVAKQLLTALPVDGSTRGRKRLLQDLQWDDKTLYLAEEHLKEKGILGVGKGQGGSLYRCDNDKKIFLGALPKDGSSSSNAVLRDNLGWGEERYRTVKEMLLEKNVIEVGRGQGGTVRRRV